MNKRVLHKTKLLLHVSLFIPAFAVAQSSKLLATADQYYVQGDWYNAAKLYEQAEDSTRSKHSTVRPYMLPELSRTAQQSSNRDILFRLASSYFQLRDYKKAQPWFGKIKEVHDTALFYYAVCQRATGDYQEAENNFQRFLSKHTIADTYSIQANKELEDIRFITIQLGKKDTTAVVHTVADASETSDYALTTTSDNQVVITSTRTDSALLKAGSNPYLNQLYLASVDNHTLAVNNKLGIDAAKDTHAGLASFTPDGSTLFFTRWYKNGNDTIAAIYSSTRTGTVWSAPVKLNNQVNAPGYQSLQPFVTADGRYLLFASNKPGGLGKYDLWYAPLDKQYQPGTAINFGATVNTKDNEETPFYHQSGHTLVFASDGRTGMGGLDLYAAKGDFSAWDTIVNLGYPVNSNKDDLYFYCSNTDSLWQHGYLSSDRASECCLQLFAVDFIKPVVLVPAVITPAPSMSDTTAITDATVPDSSIESEPVVATRDRSVIYFAFNRASLQTASTATLDAIAELLRSDTSIIADINGYTDGIGTTAYNLQLSQQRALSCQRYFLSKGVSKQQLRIYALGACCPAAPERLPSGKDNPSGRKQNRRVVITIHNSTTH